MYTRKTTTKLTFHSLSYLKMREICLRESKKGNTYFNYQSPPGKKIESGLKEIKVRRGGFTLS